MHTTRLLRIVCRLRSKRNLHQFHFWPNLCMCFNILKRAWNMSCSMSEWWNSCTRDWWMSMSLWMEWNTVSITCVNNHNDINYNFNNTNIKYVNFDG